MTLPKFLCVIQRRHFMLIGRNRLEDFTAETSEAALSILAARGQRPKGGVWPDGFGVVELEDIPKPEPLRTAYNWRHCRTGESIWLVATVTFDADDNATVTRA